MIDDVARASAVMDGDIIASLAELAVEKDEGWRFHGTLLILVDMIATEMQETEDEQDFAKLKEVLNSILTLMLYLDKMPTEDEIEADVLKFNRILGRINGDDEEEEPLS
jgi:hypothetical protein